uniref:Zinc finger protein 496 n=1 Tax=Canis lupus familiaris TaxID=9615 RepID=A0A8C0SSD9_CANLF
MGREEGAVSPTSPQPWPQQRPRPGGPEGLWRQQDWVPPAVGSPGPQARAETEQPPERRCRVPPPPRPFQHSGAAQGSRSALGGAAGPGAAGLGAWRREGPARAPPPPPPGSPPTPPPPRAPRVVGAAGRRPTKPPAGRRGPGARSRGGRGGRGAPAGPRRGRGCRVSPPAHTSAGGGGSEPLRRGDLPGPRAEQEVSQGREPELSGPSFPARPADSAAARLGGPRHRPRPRPRHRHRHRGRAWAAPPWLPPLHSRAQPRCLDEPGTGRAPASAGWKDEERLRDASAAARQIPVRRRAGLPGGELKHCEDPVVIDDGDGPPDQEQERLPTEPQSDLAKGQDTQPVALAQGPGLPSRLQGQLSGDPVLQDPGLLDANLRDAQQVMALQLPSSRLSPFEDMIFCFSQEDWSLLDPAQTGFYGEFIIGEDCGVSLPPSDSATQLALSQGEDSEPQVPEFQDPQGKDVAQASYLDFPSLQPFQVEERRKRDELQVPEFQTCQQMALGQSTCPAGGDALTPENGLDEEVTIEIILSSSGDEDSQLGPYCTDGSPGPTEKQHGLPTSRRSGAEAGSEMPTSSSKKSYICPNCGKIFRWRVNFIRHLRSRREREKPHECSVCGELFSDSEDLDGHLEIHEAQKPYRCGACGKSFRLNSHLLSHRRTHLRRDRGKELGGSGAAMGSGGAGPGVLLAQGAAELNVQCCECGKAFQRPDHLARHRSSAHGEDRARPFQCRYCVKSFSQNCDLLRHQRLHMKRRSKQALNSY